MVLDLSVKRPWGDFWEEGIGGTSMSLEADRQTQRRRGEFAVMEKVDQPCEIFGRIAACEIIWRNCNLLQAGGWSCLTGIIYN